MGLLSRVLTSALPALSCFALQTERDGLAARCTEFVSSLGKLKDSTYREAGLRREYEHRMQVRQTRGQEASKGNQLCRINSYT